MVITSSTYENLRDIVLLTVVDVFGGTDIFLDFLEYEEYGKQYDCCIDPNGENYIINRDTGDYVNWYKLTHIGRDPHVSMVSSTDDIKEFLKKFFTDFKNSEKED